ncbi:MAG: hypothetical protein PVG03_14475 [Desulfarculaceae bacterium]|jgi:hypothetical protein
MLYTLDNGRTIDTGKELDFEERNFVQKMMIYVHLKMGLEEFQRRWRNEGNPVWQGPECLKNPSPAVLILLDLEKKIKAKA